MPAPSICQGNNTCDPRIPHVCYNGTNAALLDEEPWASAPQDCPGMYEAPDYGIGLWVTA